MLNTEAPSSRAVLVVGADAATLELLREWLGGAGWRVLGEPAGESCYALVLVDLPFPRHMQAAQLQRVARDHEGTPVIALSATFHSGVERSGDVARSLGVAGVLPKPLRREALLAAAQLLSRESAP